MKREYDFAHWGAELPKASCICITYGRPHLIGEAIECFLRQDYAGEKELIILNDQEGVTLSVPEHPEIILVNEVKRYATIGTKRNVATTLSSGQVVFPWDDDDISLPWRLSLTIGRMVNHAYFKPSDFWWWTGGGVQHKRGVLCHPMCAYSREVFDAVGGYPDIQSGQDQGLEQRINDLGLQDTAELGVGDTFYVYRMIGVDTYHLSHYGFGNGFEECEEYVGRTVEKGEYPIAPGWRHEYVGICETAGV